MYLYFSLFFSCHFISCAFFLYAEESAPKLEEADSDDESDEDEKGEAGEAGDAGKHSRSEKKARKVQ